MGASELNECQPVFRFLRPAGANTAAFCQPTEGAFDDPTARRELGFARDGTILDNGFIATTAMFDMSNIAFLFDKLMDIGKVVAFVKTQVLLDLGWVRPRCNNGNDNLIDQPLIMLIGSRDIDRQRRTTRIHQEVNFAASFSSVYRTLARRLTTQRRWTGFAINGLPRPSNAAPLVIKLGKLAHQSVKNTALLPFLEAVMDSGATHPEPRPLHRFPLATCPQHIPYSVYHSPVVGSFSPWPPSFWLFWQHPLQSSPQPSWHLKIIDILRFLGMILVHTVSVLIVVSYFDLNAIQCSFQPLSLFTDRYLVQIILTRGGLSYLTRQIRRCSHARHRDSGNRDPSSCAARRGYDHPPG
jgi:hypothetical protein